MHPLRWIKDALRRAKRRRQDAAIRRQEEHLLRKRVEEAVSATEPRIRQARGYQNRLMPAVKNALAHCRQLIEDVPGPFDIRPELWGQDPLVTAYFATIDEGRSALGSSPELRSYFSGPSALAAHALLTMKTEEKRVFRSAARGRLLQRDVPHTSVNFFHHRFTSVFATVSEVRQDLQHRAFHFLLSCALEELVALEKQEARLEHEHEVLQVQWRLQKSRQRDLGALMNGGGNRRTDGAGRQIIDKVRQQLDTVRSRIDEPSDFLAHLERVLLAPEQYLRLVLDAPRLNQMGIKVGRTDPNPGNEIPYAVLSLGVSDWKRAAVLARVFRSDAANGSTENARQ